MRIDGALGPEGCGRLSAAGCVEGLWKKVLKIDRLSAGGLWQRPAGEGKQANRAFGAREMHPFWCYAPPFPRRGNFTCRSAFTLTSSSKYSVAKISPYRGDVAAGDRRGAFPMWRPCRGSPSRAKLVPGLHIKGLSNKSPDRCRRRGFTVLPPTGGIINSLPLKGKRLTTFCASLTLLQNVFAVHRKAAIHNPRPERPSNLRTLRPTAGQS